MRTLIIAGNYRQAHKYASEHKLRREDWFFTVNEDKLLGVRDIEIVRTGEYWRNPINDSNYLTFISKKT